MKLSVAFLALVLLCAAVGVLAVTKEGGVIVEILKKAPKGAECAYKGDSVTVHYTGRLKSAEGKVFDSSRTSGNPFDFVLGNGQVIAGWEVGVEGMCVGETRSIVTPPSMAYGDRGLGTVIPAKATLFFEVELLALQAGSAHPRSISMQQVLILLPLIGVIALFSYIGFKILKTPDQGKVQKKKK